MIGFLQDAISQLLTEFANHINYALGYGFAIIGAFPIGLLLNRMSLHVHDDILKKDPRLKNFICYQRTYLGIIERILYVSSLLTGYGHFIAFWITLKMGGSILVYDLWKKGLPGRVSYMNTVFGNGLSILYAAVGFGIIKWWATQKTEIALGIPALLILATLVLYACLRGGVKKPKGGT